MAKSAGRFAFQVFCMKLVGDRPDHRVRFVGLVLFLRLAWIKVGAS